MTPCREGQDGSGEEAGVLRQPVVLLTDHGEKREECGCPFIPKPQMHGATDAFPSDSFQICALGERIIAIVMFLGLNEGDPGVQGPRSNGPAEKSVIWG